MDKKQKQTKQKSDSFSMKLRKMSKELKRLLIFAVLPMFLFSFALLVNYINEKDRVDNSPTSASKRNDILNTDTIIVTAKGIRSDEPNEYCRYGYPLMQVKVQNIVIGQTCVTDEYSPYTYRMTKQDVNISDVMITFVNGEDQVGPKNRALTVRSLAIGDKVINMPPEGSAVVAKGVLVDGACSEVEVKTNENTLYCNGYFKLQGL